MSLHTDCAASHCCRLPQELCSSAVRASVCDTMCCRVAALLPQQLADMPRDPMDVLHQAFDGPGLGPTLDMQSAPGCVRPTMCGVPVT